MFAAAFLALDSSVALAADEDTDKDAGTITWALTPYDGEDTDHRVSLRHEIDPGSTVSDKIILTNYSDRAAAFDVYASDGLISESGDFDLLPPGEEPADGGSWIALGDIEEGTLKDGVISVELDAEESVVIPLSIAVPENATPGDHPAGVVAQYVPEDDGAVRFASRVGVRAHLRVTGDVVATIEPKISDIEYVPSWNPFVPATLRVSYALENIGNVRLGSEATTQISGPFGLLEQESSEATREVLPGQQTTATAEFSFWPLFHTSGEIDAQPVVVGEDEISQPKAASTSISAWTVPWSQLALLVIIAGVIVLIIVMRGRGKKRMEQRIAEAVAKAQGGTESADQAS